MATIIIPLFTTYRPVFLLTLVTIGVASRCGEAD